MSTKIVLKICLIGAALLALPLASARAQFYDTFEVIRLPERTLYIFPRGYAPAVATPYAPVDYPWFNPWYAQPTVASPVMATPGILPQNTVSPLSYTGATDTASSATSITLRVPEDAEVWIQGKKMEEKGSERRFNLPSLDSRVTYDYDVRVEWMENGKKKSDSTRLNIHAGDQQSINYIAAMATSKVGAGQPARNEAGQGQQ